MHSHVLLFGHGYGVKTAVTMKCFIDYSPPLNHATPIAVFLHPSTAVRFYPLLSYLSPPPEHFFIIKLSYIFIQALPSLSPSFFPSMGVDPCFILSLPSHSSLILFDYLPLIPRRDGKLLCCWFSKTKLWKVRTIQLQHVHKLSILVAKTAIHEEATRTAVQMCRWLAQELRGRNKLFWMYIWNIYVLFRNDTASVLAGWDHEIIARSIENCPSSSVIAVPGISASLPENLNPVLGKKRGIFCHPVFTGSG